MILADCINQQITNGAKPYPWQELNFKKSLHLDLHYCLDMSFYLVTSICVYSMMARILTNSFISVYISEMRYLHHHHHHYYYDDDDDCCPHLYCHIHNVLVVCTLQPF